MIPELLGYVRLTRPANLPTAAADILTGVAIAFFFQFGGPGINNILNLLDSILFLLFSSVFLYAGGVVLNDVFDFNIDKVERPERPIPKGLVSLRSAIIFGIVLLFVGIFLSFLVSNLCGGLALVLAVSIALYDGFSKKNGFLGPLNMGVCRGLNLILGMSILGSIEYWWLAFIPLVYIFAITLISRGEVHGKNNKHIVLAGVLYVWVILSILALVYLYTHKILLTLLFLLTFTILIFRPLINAYRTNSPGNIKKAVVAGVLSLIVMDASLAVGFSDWPYGLAILALLPISIALSKLFSVT